MITITSEEGLITYDKWDFSGGEIGIRLSSQPKEVDECIITAYYTKSEDLMELLLVTSALQEKYKGILIHLVMPYFPYARQDRVCFPGEPLSSRVACELINAQMYVSVEIWDAHSNVVPALLDSCTNIHCADFVETFHKKLGILVSPDAGSYNKVAECANRTRSILIEGMKHRDPKTGQIIHTSILNGNADNVALNKPQMLIVDDICDGGRTFVELAHALRGKFKDPIIDLYVTHGIFSKGLEPFKGLIRKVYCANPFPGTPKEVIKVERVLR